MRPKQSVMCLQPGTWNADRIVFPLRLWSRLRRVDERDACLGAIGGDFHGNESAQRLALCFPDETQIYPSALIRPVRTQGPFSPRYPHVCQVSLHRQMLPPSPLGRTACPLVAQSTPSRNGGTSSRTRAQVRKLHPDSAHPPYAPSAFPQISGPKWKPLMMIYKHFR